MPLECKDKKFTANPLGLNTVNAKENYIGMQTKILSYQISPKYNYNKTISLNTIYVNQL